MAKTNTAVFAQTPRTGVAACTAAVTSPETTAPTNIVQVAAAGADGAILTRLTAMPRATVTATSLLLYLSKDAGVTKYLIDSEVMPAQTVDAVTPIAETVFTNYDEDEPFRLEAGDRLYVGTRVALASGIVFRAEWTDF